MGIFDALNTAVSGLQAQSFALQNISGNIANSQTTGYKETDTYFEDLVSAAALGYQTANGVTAGSKSTNTVQGTIQGASVSTDMAINGNGWFVVAKPTGTLDNQPVFSGVDNYTRAGDFQLNSGGYLVNGGDYNLMGIPINPRKSGRQFASGSAIHQRLRAGAGNDGAHIPAQPAKHAEIRNADRQRFRGQSACRRSAGGNDHRQRRQAFSGCSGNRRRHGKFCEY